MAKSKDGEELYFSYGSNMNPARMNLRKAFFKSRVPAKLIGYQLSFTFKRPDGFASANITPQAGCTVHGALYTLEEGGLDKLDEFEGVSMGNYARQKVLVELGGSESPVEVTTYIVTKEFYKEGLKPTEEYLGNLLAGKDIVPGDYFEWLKTFGDSSGSWIINQKWFFTRLSRQVHELILWHRKSIYRSNSSFNTCLGLSGWPPIGQWPSLRTIMMKPQRTASRRQWIALLVFMGDEDQDLLSGSLWYPVRKALRWQIDGRPLY